MVVWSLFGNWIGQPRVIVFHIGFYWAIFLTEAVANPPVVLDSQEIVLEDHSITYERIVPPVLKPQPVKTPAPVVSPTEEVPEAPAPVQLMVSSMKVDTVWSEVRFKVGDKEAVFRTTLPMHYLDGLFDYERDGRTTYLFQIPLDNPVDEVILAKQKLLPPAILPTQYLWTSKINIPVEVKQAVEDLHRYYDSHQTLITTAYFERETRRIAAEKALLDNPPKPKDILIQYFPIRSSSR